MSFKFQINCQNLLNYKNLCDIIILDERKVYHIFLQGVFTMEVINKFVAFIQGFIAYIQAIVAYFRDKNDGKNPEFPTFGF